MYTLITRLPLKELLLRQAPTLLAALVIAEMFYKWHSFLLETGGFLLTWFVLDAASTLVAAAFRGRS
ncbi:hypothetical protein [Variovorax sp. J22R115]|uniref:hypothetical protein n=1 Tax=Variovorax sp. J22R115 TaxID=3053509 RepID=UPI0025757149|nr:hypothetical protein [Variovorax sp. J22R115]MDM0053016.1 hypothetical protein [Variovorax sp. J22R115]